MWIRSRVPVGPSKAPIATPIQSRWSGSQKSDDPHTEQNPRRTFSDEWNHVTRSAPSTVSAAFGTSVDTK